MNSELIEIVATIAVQHLWQSAMLLLLGAAALKLHPLRASTRSWIWLSLLVLSVLAPLAVFVPTVEHAAPPQQVVVVHSDTAISGGVSVDFGEAPAAASPISITPPDWLLKAALVLWALGVLWNIGMLCAGWHGARRLRQGATALPSAEALVRHELPPGTIICTSDSVCSPMVVGLVHSCILTPRQLVHDLPSAMLRDIINHEIAHVRRRDLWISVAQQMFLAVFWWSPALRLIASRLDLAREMACDEEAATRAGHGKIYARSLLAAIEKLAGRQHNKVLAIRICGAEKAISQRVKGVLDMDTTVRKYGKKVPALLWSGVMLAAVTVTFAATPRLAAHGSATQAETVQGIKALRMIDAVKAGKIDTVSELLAQGFDINGGVDGDGTALIAAARSGDLAMVEALLGMNATVGLAWRGDGNPLIAASVQGHQKVVERLVAAGADVNAVCFMDETPLINAVRAGRVDTVKYLVARGANVNLGAWADGKRWRTPLNQAQDDAMRKYLIGQGATN